MFDGDTNLILTTIPLGFYVYAPFRLAINPITNRICIASLQNFVAVVDGLANQIVDYIDTTSEHNQGALKGIAVDPTTSRIYKAYESGLLIIADGATTRLLASS